jgi:LmbE family N-acetylglucosaminyl deacetylase
MPSADVLTGSPLANPDALPLRPPDGVTAFGPTLVVAPHPDDESLGCGGAIALLRRFGLPVHVLLISDGSGSHPGSLRYPPADLAELRQRELRAALAQLDVDAACLTCLGLPDRQVPRAGSAAFAAAAERVCEALRRLLWAPKTVLLPWRRDPHIDHRGTWELLTKVLGHAHPRPRLLEYPIWVWELAQAGDAPRPDEVRAWRLDVTPVLEQKLAAIAAHVSQTTPLIDDADRAWCLAPDMLAHFAHPWEVYLEP